MDNIVLKMEGICKTFGEARVLKSVDFELATERFMRWSAETEPESLR